MTPLRQAVSAGLFAAALAVALPTSAEPLAPMGPPTAPAAVDVPPPAPPAPPVPAAAPKTAKGAPAWLASKPQPKAATGKPALPSAGRMAGLLVVVGALGGAALYFKRRGKPSAKNVPGPQRLTVLSSTRIGPKAHAVVVSVAGRQMLLGVTDASVKRLAFIDEIAEEELERAPAARPLATTVTSAALSVRAAAGDPTQNKSFSELLKTAFKKREQVAGSDAASILAAETTDVVGGRPAASNVRMLDVEGQAQGLVRRLSGPRP